ncbi:hypothetical protein OIU78_028087 [Salix suchowensis]|nr:hypothetical protein OIU78_028087 [Salix suchowensis]
MRDSSKTVRCLFCFMFIAELGVSLNCTTSCGSRGVDIRFPFWIKDRQPDQCGYPGFALSCIDGDDIVLELRTAGKLHIEKIDYRNQVILASDPQGKESLLSCTKMYDVPVPHDIRLSWSIPNCGSCEATGKQCRLRKNSTTELETECYGLHKEFELRITCGFEHISSTCCEVPDK